MTREWIALGRDEGKGHDLPLYARALHAQLHKRVDGNGRIPAALDAEGDLCVAMAKAIAYRFGASQGDRRLIAGHLRQLQAVGGLSITAEGLTLYALDDGEPVRHMVVGSDRTRRAKGAEGGAAEPRRRSSVINEITTSSHEFVTSSHELETKSIATTRNDSVHVCRGEERRREKKEEAGGGRARAHAHTYARAGASTDEPPSPAERPSVIGSTKSTKTPRVDAVARCAGAAWIDSPPSAERDALESALAASLGDAAECELFGRYLASRDFAHLVATRFKCSLPTSVDWFVFRSRETRALECGQRFEGVIRAYRSKRTELVEGLERETKVRAAVDAYAAEHPSLVAVWESSREAIERDARRYHAEQSEQRPQFARCLGYVDAYAARMVEAARPLSPGEYENGLRSNGRDAIERETKRRETIAKARGEQTQPATTTPAAARPEEMSLSARWAALASSPRRDPSESAAQFAATVAADKARGEQTQPARIVPIDPAHLPAVRKPEPPRLSLEEARELRREWEAKNGPILGRKASGDDE